MVRASADNWVVDGSIPSTSTKYIGDDMSNKKLPKHRNEFAYALATSKSGRGAHGKTKKAQRRKDKIDFKREVDKYR